MSLDNNSGSLRRSSETFGWRVRRCFNFAWIVENVFGSVIQRTTGDFFWLVHCIPTELTTRNQFAKVEKVIRNLTDSILDKHKRRLQGMNATEQTAATSFEQIVGGKRSSDLASLHSSSSSVNDLVWMFIRILIRRRRHSR